MQEAPDTPRARVQDYLLSLTGSRALRELPSPGKSGSVFFLCDDERFLVKTVSREEARLLLRASRPTSATAARTRARCSRASTACTASSRSARAWRPRRAWKALLVPWMSAAGGDHHS